MKTFLLVISLLLLFAVEILHVYFIMPFPGSQKKDTIQIAYWLNNNIWWLRILFLAVVLYSLLVIMRHSRIWKRGLVVASLLFYATVFYFFNYRFKADKMFYQPVHKNFADINTNKIPVDKLVIGIELNGEAKAYPIQLIGYHHQVRDTIGKVPVMVTYCTVCRTGRVFSPTINGNNETFRLVGMDHFNAMFEDATTKSWWQQATGVSIAGPLKGTALPELPSRQVSLDVWLRDHPGSLIMQADTNFVKQYESLAKYDKGTIDGSLEKRDSASWKFKSWVIGVKHDNSAKAYDWNELVDKKIIQDSLAGLPILLTLENDTASFHAWNRSVDGKFLQFKREEGTGLLKDLNTGSTWNMNGICTDGELKGQQLKPVQAYQEFWHSWSTFHPGTTRLN